MRDVERYDSIPRYAKLSVVKLARLGKPHADYRAQLTSSKVL